MAAVANDDEAAAQWSEHGSTKPPPPALTDWTPVVDMLAKVYDRLGDLIALTAGKSKPPPPHERPKTAMHRAGMRHKQRKHNALMARIEQARQRGGSHG